MERKAQKKRGFLAFVFRFIYKSVILLLAFLFILSVAVFIIFKYDKFRQPVVNYAVKQANEFLLADVSLDDLHIHKLNYVQLKDLLVTVRSDTMLYARRVNLNFNPLSFKSKKFRITRIKLEDAIVNLERFKSDSVWNYNLIAPPGNSDKPKGDMPELTLDIKNIQLFRSRFIYRDSINSVRINSNPDYKQMDYSDFEISNLNLDMDAKLILNKNIYNVNIKELNCVEKYSGFSLTDFETNALLDESGIYLSDLFIQTPRSKIDIDANLKKLSIFKQIDISKVKFDIDLNAEPLDATDIEFFAETGMKIKRTDKIQIKTEGTLNDLNISNLEIEKNSTKLDMKGSVRNVLDFENFNYSVFIKNSQIYRNDLLSILPEFREIIPKINDAKVNSLKAKGYLDSVYTNFDIVSDAGNAKGYASVMYLEQMNYSAEIDLENINLAQFTGSEKIKSSVTGEIMIKGNGISPENIKADINARLNKSEIAGYKIDNFILKAHTDKYNKIMYLDSLFIQLPRNKEYTYSDNELFYEPKSHLFANGKFDFTEEIPDYEMKIDYSAINLSEIIGNSNLPQHISGDIIVDSEGFTLDDLDGFLYFNFDDVLFSDRVLLPFDMNLQINSDSLQKELMLSSYFFDISLNGNYRFDNLIANLNLQNLLIQDYISLQSNRIFEDDREIEEKRINKISDSEFKKMDAELIAEIHKISPLMAFVDNLDVFFTGDFKIDFESDTNRSTVQIDKMNIDKLSLANNGFSLEANSHSFSGGIQFNKKDSIMQLTRSDFNLIHASEFTVNGNSFDSTSFELSLNDNMISLGLSGLINNEMFSSVNAELEFTDEQIISKIDNLTFEYYDLIKIENNGSIDFSFKDKTLDIENFKLSVDSVNQMQLSGGIRLFGSSPQSGDSIGNSIVFNDFVLNAGYNNLQRFTRYLPEDLQENLKTLNADLTEFEIMLNGDIKNINMQINSTISDINLKGYSLGSLNTTAILSDYVFELNSDMSNVNEREFLRANLKSLELNKENYSIDSLSRIIAEIKMNEFPLPLVSPFIPVLNNITGNASADINVSGEALNPDINGNLNISNSSFILESNNIKYMADGDVKFTMDEIETNNLILKNTRRDSENGIAKINALIKLKNLSPDYFDISVESSNFKILGNSSQDPMPDLYGDLKISTGDNPLSFVGTLNDPALTGDVNVISADLKMPEFTQQQQAKTQLKYQIIGDKVQHSIVNTKDSIIKINEKEPSDIMKVLDFNLRVKLLGQVSILIDLGTLGEIYANVTMQNRDEAIVYQKDTEKKTENLTGQIILKDNSTFKSFKVLQTSGEISFPTGEIDNPHLNLEASYKGTTMINNQPKQYTVIMYITGSQEQPKVKFTYLIDGQEAVGDPKQIEEDAILLLVAGRTKSSSSQGAASPDMLQQSLNSGISNYGSQLLTDFLMKTGSIQSVDLDFKGEGFDEATVKFTGQTELFGGNVNWTIGGALSDFSGNNEIILDVPLTNYTNNEFWRNFIFQFTRASHTNTTIQDQNSKNWEIKFKVGGSF